uniref:Uncharacterized protein n=1 Tax=Phasianus colchicus TaxID=9054 RepID=A0A669QGV4_PHACC
NPSLGGTAPVPTPCSQAVTQRQLAEKPPAGSDPEVTPSRNTLKAQRTNVRALCTRVPAHQAPAQHSQAFTRRYNNFSSAFTRRKEFSSSPQTPEQFGEGARRTDRAGEFSQGPLLHRTSVYVHRQRV